MGWVGKCMKGGFEIVTLQVVTVLLRVVTSMFELIRLLLQVVTSMFESIRLLLRVQTVKFEPQRSKLDAQTLKGCFWRIQPSILKFVSTNLKLTANHDAIL